MNILGNSVTNTHLGDTLIEGDLRVTGSINGSGGTLIGDSLIITGDIIGSEVKFDNHYGYTSSFHLPDQPSVNGQVLTAGTDGSMSWSSGIPASNAWGLTGTAVAANEYLGTTNDDLRLKVPVTKKIDLLVNSVSILQATGSELISSVPFELSSVKLNDGGAFSTNLGCATGLSENTIFKLPPTNGSSNQVLQTNGSGITSWVDQDGAPNAFVKTGNSFGQDVYLGTNDNYDLRIIRGSVNVIHLGTDGTIFSDRNIILKTEDISEASIQIDSSANVQGDVIIKTSQFMDISTEEAGSIMSLDANGAGSSIQMDTGAGGNIQLAVSGVEKLRLSDTQIECKERLVASDEIYLKSGANNLILTPNPAMSGNNQWILPANMGSNGQVLATNGTNTLSWQTGGGAYSTDPDAWHKSGDSMSIGTYTIGNIGANGSTLTFRNGNIDHIILTPTQNVNINGKNQILITASNTLIPTDFSKWDLGKDSSLFSVSGIAGINANQYLHYLTINSIMSTDETITNTHLHSLTQNSRVIKDTNIFNGDLLKILETEEGCFYEWPNSSRVMQGKPKTILGRETEISYQVSYVESERIKIKQHQNIENENYVTTIEASPLQVSPIRWRLPPQFPFNNSDDIPLTGKWTSGGVNDKVIDLSWGSYADFVRIGGNTVSSAMSTGTLSAHNFVLLAGGSGSSNHGLTVTHTDKSVYIHKKLGFYNSAQDQSVGIIVDGSHANSYDIKLPDQIPATNKILKVTTGGVVSQLEWGDQNLISDAQNNVKGGTGAGAALLVGAVDNTLIGVNAGTLVTNGDNNVFIGKNAGNSINTESNNVVVGSNSYLGNVVNGTGKSVVIGANAVQNWVGDALPSDSGIIAIGYQAYKLGTSGTGTIVIGNDACDTGIGTGDFNTFIGTETARSVTSATLCTTVGYRAGNALTTQDSCTFVGANSGQQCTGVFNTGIGANTCGALIASSGTYNTGIGANCLSQVGSGGSNVGIGPNACRYLSSSNNIGIGNGAVGSLTGGGNNIGIGSFSLSTALTAFNNTAIGFNALKDILSSNNTAIGYNALVTLTNGTGNIAIGTDSGTSATTSSNRIAIGYQAISNADNQTMFGNASLTQIVCNSSAVVALGTDTNPFSTATSKAYKIRGSTSGNITLDTGTVVTDYTIRWPTAIGTTGQILQATVSGNVATMAWATIPAFTNFPVENQVISTADRYLLNDIGNIQLSGITVSLKSPNNVTPTSSVNVSGNIVELKSGTNLTTYNGNIFTLESTLRIKDNLLLGKYNGFTTSSAQLANISYRLPLIAPTVNQILQSDGSSNLNWITPTNIIRGSSGIITFDQPGAVTSYTIRYPTAIGTSGQYLQSTVSGTIATMAWTTQNFNTDAQNNIKAGLNAGGTLQVTALNNVCVGTSAGSLVTTGDNNTMIGNNSTTSLETGSGNTCLGASSGVSTVGANNRISLGYQAFSDIDNQCMIGNGNLTQIVPNSTAIVSLGTNSNPFTNTTSKAYKVRGSTSGNITLDSGGTITDYTIRLPTVIGTSDQILQCTVSGSVATMVWSHQNLVSSGTNIFSLGSLSSLSSGTDITAIGYNTLQYISTNNLSTAIGSNTGTHQTGARNTFIGSSCGNGKLASSNGSQNTAMGVNALQNVETGSFNTVMGNDCASKLTTGNSNVAIGLGAMTIALGASTNVAIGNNSLNTLNAGSGNTVVGHFSGSSIINGTNNVMIGSDTNVASNSQTNSIAIGYQAISNSDNQCVIGNNAITKIRSMSDGLCELGDDSYKFKTVRSKLYTGGIASLGTMTPFTSFDLTNQYLPYNLNEISVSISRPLPNGLYQGQSITIYVQQVSFGALDFIIIPTGSNAAGWSSIALNPNGDTVTLAWLNSKWYIISNYGVVIT